MEIPVRGFSEGNDVPYTYISLRECAKVMRKWTACQVCSVKCANFVTFQTCFPLIFSNIVAQKKAVCRGEFAAFLRVSALWAGVATC